MYVHVLNDNAYSVTEQNGSSRAGWYFSVGQYTAPDNLLICGQNQLYNKSTKNDN